MSGTSTLLTQSDGNLPPLTGVISAIATDPQMAGLCVKINAPELHITGPDEVWSYVSGVLARNVPLLIVTASGRQAENLTQELSAMMGDSVAYFPGWETFPHERLSPTTETLGQRVEVLSRLKQGTSDTATGEYIGDIQPLNVVVAPIRAVSQPIMDNTGSTPALTFVVGKDTPFEQAQRTLVSLGYTKVDMVTKRGEFATRGGLVDVFPATAQLPVRVDFWGDEVSEMHPFSVADQRTIQDIPLESVTVFPAKELLLTPEIAQHAADLVHSGINTPELVEILDKVSQGLYPSGIESLIPILYQGNLVPLNTFMPANTHILVVHPTVVSQRAEDLKTTGQQFLEASWESAAMGGSTPLDLSEVNTGGTETPQASDGSGTHSSDFLSLNELASSAQQLGQSWWTCSASGVLDGVQGLDGESYELTYKHGPRPRGNMEAIGDMMTTIRHRLGSGAAVAFLAPNPSVAARMLIRFKEAGIAAAPVGVDLSGVSRGIGRIPQVKQTVADVPQPGRVTIYHALNFGGLDFSGVGDSTQQEAGGLLVIAEADVTGNRVNNQQTGKRKPARKRNKVDPLALGAGDLVVHDTHGIGKFVGITERLVGKAPDQVRREYVVLEYAPSKRGGPGDRLYVPMDQLDLLSRYVGGEKPALSKMGGSDWKSTKRKARGAVREIAGELVELYAKRQAAPGYSFDSDNEWQRQLEDIFPFVETEDQQTAIEEVKADMEKPVPMDRVIVGDVGYGKTEVAVRAAFKAVQSGKQVAILVPTTLLAQQHLATFTERMQDFPVRIKELSRFTPDKEAKQILQDMSKGEVDIVIGTHRLIQTGVQWKDLGLVIIDEEQRFGVEHKEHIKALRTHVDVLTMSATPIPRTLEMSMAGIREMSTILTPPEERQPVLTYVGPQDDKQVAAAIRREMLRDGQVFYVHNKVKSIEKTAQKIRDMVPEARVVVAHGQMSEAQLEKTVEGFWNREFDVLVSTTIVETGLDIPNANTLIVENANHMGLSQLHQLRGRVGRSRERGYSYFLYPKGENITEISYDRLSTIAQNNDLGAGMAVAMKDLEMRGAGNVLGAEQSGHIAGVGFDLYIRLVSEAVDTYRAIAAGEVIDGRNDERKEIRIDLPYDANIPVEYIDSERLRLEAYRKIAEAHSEQDLQNVFDEFVDRYGPVPDEVQRLAVLARLRFIAREVGVQDILTVGCKISFAPMALPESAQIRLKRLYPAAQYRATAKTVLITMPKEGQGMRAINLEGESLVQWVANVLTSMNDIPQQDITGPVRSTPRDSEDKTRKA